MEITKVQAIYFSGTGTTRKLCAAVAGGTGLAVEEWDCTPQRAKAPFQPDAHTLTVLAVPSFGGRVPAPVARRLEQLQGCGPAVLQQLESIKSENKRRFASWVARESGVVLNTDAIFDVQVKRLHEYKRQLLNVLHIVHLYNQLRDNPNMNFMLPVPLASLPAVEICWETSLAGISCSAMDTR